jgi:hypothetical protein
MDGSIGGLLFAKEVKGRVSGIEKSRWYIMEVITKQCKVKRE